MNQKEIRELIEFLIDKDIAEFELERGDVKLRVKRGGAQYVVAPQAVSAPVAHVPAPLHTAATAAAAAVHSASALPAVPEPAASEDDDTVGAHIIQSPIVGTFYESPSPGAPPFVKPGDTVTVGQVLCIVEAMKLMNEIESDYSGTVVKRFVQNGQPVEYGQKLFAVKP
jgi:acetyl-CoA carboxylase biotin carboxyl carrier protein